MQVKYDVLIIGAGPAGIFTALEINKFNKNLKYYWLIKEELLKKNMPERTQVL